LADRRPQSKELPLTISQWQAGGVVQSCLLQLELSRKPAIAEDAKSVDHLAVEIVEDLRIAAGLSHEDARTAGERLAVDPMIGEMRAAFCSGGSTKMLSAIWRMPAPASPPRW
jgi:hypothetical protein